MDSALNSAMLPTSVPGVLSSSSIVSINVAAALPIKVTSSNFLLWKAQFSPLLRGYDLFAYLDGSLLRPSPISKDSSSPVSASPLVLWDRQDQLILSWLVASVSERILPHIVAAKTSKEAWNKLHHVFASGSRTRVLELKNQLFQLQRGSMSIGDYLLEILGLADTLAAANAPVSDKDLVLATLRGLGNEYQDFGTSVLLRADPVTFDDLQGLLLTQEVRMRAYASKTVSLILSANVIVRNTSGQSTSRVQQDYASRGRFGERRPWNRRYLGNSSGGGTGYNCSKSGNAFRYRNSSAAHMNSVNNFGNSRAVSSGNFGPMNAFGYFAPSPSFVNEPRVICQLCRTEGHLCAQCPQRFNHAYVDLAHFAFQEPYTGSQNVIVGSAESSGSAARPDF